MRRYVFLVLAMTSATTLRADPVVEWNVRASEVITASRLSSPAMYRTAAIVQVAVLEAVGGIKAGSSDTSIDAAVAAATRGVLVSLIPEQESTIEAAYQTALHALPESAAKTSGISAGERAAAQVLASRADDDSVPDTYRPHAAPGAYGRRRCLPAQPGASANHGSWRVGTTFGPTRRRTSTAISGHETTTKSDCSAAESACSALPSRLRSRVSGRQSRRLCISLSHVRQSIHPHAGMQSPRMPGCSRSSQWRWTTH